MLTGTCRPGKVSRTVSTSPLTLDMTVMCTPDAEILQPGAVAQGVLPAYTVNKSVTGFEYAACCHTSYSGGEADPTGQGPSDTPTVRILRQNPPSFGLSSSPSSSSSPTLPWDTAEEVRKASGGDLSGCPPVTAEKARVVKSGLPGCPYKFLESGELPFTDGNPAYGLQLHHPRFLELVGAPESARLLDCAPSFWVEELGKEGAMAAAATLQRDAGVMLSNLQILSQFAMALNRMSLYIFRMFVCLFVCFLKT